jgi:hypothetical protein
MRITLAIAWAVVIAVLHAIPGSDFPEVSFSDLFQIDKLIHAIIFTIGFYLFAEAFAEQQKKAFIRYLIVSFIAYGLLLEVLQGLIVLSFIRRH